MSAPADSDAPCVLVRVDLRPSTYRAFCERAGTANVGAALSRLADRALAPAAEAPHRYKRLTEERTTVCDLADAGVPVRELADRFEVSGQTIRNVLRGRRS